MPILAAWTAADRSPPSCSRSGIRLLGSGCGRTTITVLGVEPAEGIAGSAVATGLLWRFRRVGVRLAISSASSTPRSVYNTYHGQLEPALTGMLVRRRPAVLADWAAREQRALNGKGWDPPHLAPPGLELSITPEGRVQQDTLGHRGRARDPSPQPDA